MHNVAKGKLGEAIALKFLKRHGYGILFRNYRCVFGEMDIIARDKGILCFIEVKFRSGERFGLPKESITQEKALRLYRIAGHFINRRGLADVPSRFDVVAILEIGRGRYDIELVKEAF